MHGIGTEFLLGINFYYYEDILVDLLKVVWLGVAAHIVAVMVFLIGNISNEK